MIVRTSKLLDSQLIDLAKILLAEFGGQIIINTPINQTETYDDSTIKNYNYELDSRIIENFTYHFSPPSNAEVVIFSRGTTDKDALNNNRGNLIIAFSSRVPSAYFDEIGFFANRNGTSVLDAVQSAKVAHLLQGFSAPSEAGSDEEARKNSQIVSSQISELNKLYVRMTIGAVEAQQKLDQIFSERESEQAKSFSKRNSQLDQREKELRRRAQELNDRAPQHERRRLRESLTKDLKGSIANNLTNSERNLYLSYLMYFLIGSIFIGLSIYWAAAGSVATGEKFWVVSVKSFAAGLGAAAFYWAGVSGYKNAAAARIEYENSVNRYAFDMDRASWIVETILQMNANEGSKIPQEWLDAVCRDLFSLSERSNEDSSSLEAFAALFDATAKARIGTSGIDFEIDRKGARQLAQSTG